MKSKFISILLSFASVTAIALPANADEISFSEGTNFGISVSPNGDMIAMDLQGIMWSLPNSRDVATAITSGQQPEVREPSFSPNGKKIAFQGFHAGYFHIWTINRDGSGLKQITSGKFDDREPDWNEDGDTITFASDRTGNYDIWDINLKSGALTQLTTHKDDEGHPHKSSDGKRLLHTREIKGRYSEVVLQDDLDAERVETVIKHAEGMSYFRPAWHTDNTGFSYISHNDNEIKLNYVTDVLSLKAARDVIVIDQGDIFPFRPHWIKDGVYYTADGIIKYAEVRQNINAKEELSIDQGEIIEVPFTATINSVRPKYTRKTHDFDSDEAQGVLGIGSMDVNPKTNQLLYTALGDMWLQDGSGPAQNIDIDAIGQVNDPTWSPNGSRIAFVAERDGQMDIWTRNMISGEEQRLTNDKGREYRISWSRDGSKIAYLSTRGVSNTWGRASLNVIDIEYGNTIKLDPSVFTPGRPVWAKDGDHVLMAVVKPATSRFREGMHAIRQYHLESGRSKLLDMPNNIGLSTRDGSGPVIAPDGNKMAYVSEGEIRIVTVSASGDITGTIDNRCLDLAHMPRWKSNSEDVYYLSGKTLKTCNVRTGDKAELPITLTWMRDIASDKTIHVGRLFDGVRDGYRENVDVYISGGRITKITPHGTEAPIGEQIDYSKHTMIPGIMAGHTHQTELYGEKLGRNWLAYGITSVRDPGTNPYKSLMRKETWESANQKGPRMFYAGWLTGGARIYYGQSYNAITERALRHELLRAKELNYDMLKSYVRLPDEFQQILVEEGHKMGIPISSHEISPAVQNSMDSVEHIAATSRRGYSPKFSSLAASYQDVMNILSSSGLFITPTAILDGGYFKYFNQYPEYLSDIKYSTFLDQYQRESQMRSSSASYAEREISHNPAILKTIKTLHDKGANFAAGTDSPFIPYGIAQHFEMIMFVDAGLTPADAIRAASLNVAKNLGVDKDLGSVEVGKVADMAIIAGDPLANIADIRNIAATIRGGHHYTINELTTNRNPQ